MICRRRLLNYHATTSWLSYANLSIVQGHNTAKHSPWARTRSIQWAFVSFDMPTKTFAIAIEVTFIPTTIIMYDVWALCLPHDHFNLHILFKIYKIKSTALFMWDWWLWHSRFCHSTQLGWRLHCAKGMPNKRCTAAFFISSIACGHNECVSESLQHTRMDVPKRAATGICSIFNFNSFGWFIGCISSKTK